MKIKKIICVLVSVVLLFEIFSMVSYAVPVKLEAYSNQVLHFPENMPEEVDNSGAPKRFFSNPFGTYHFRDLLTAPQKVVYDCITENKAGLLTDGEFQLVCPKTSEDISLTVEAALCAVIDDYPEYFWIGGYGWSGGYIQNSTYYLNFYFVLNTSDYADWDVLRQSYYTVVNAVESAPISGATRYDKVKSIHDYICSITEYVSAPMAHEPSGVFVNGQAVCEGYAEAFKLLCDRENIPCIIVVGTGNGGGHEWNYVQMENGFWYGMDVTWDDQGENVYYDYFLVGSKTLTSGSFRNKKFGDGSSGADAGDHINTGTHFQNPQYALTYPSISENSYALLIPIMNSTVSLDSSRNLLFLNKTAILSQQFYCTYAGYASFAPSNNRASISGNTTGATLTVSSPISKIYKVVRRGDINADNAVGKPDIDLVKAYIAGDENAIAEIDSSVEKFNAADFNQDGVIDGFDLYYVNNYVYTDRFLNG